MKVNRQYQLAGLVILLLCWLPGGRYFSALAAVPVEHEIVNVLDSAVDALAAPAADYRRTFQDAVKRLPPHSPDFLNVDIKNFLARAPGAGADFKCGADFMRYRARQELWRLKDKLLNSNPPPAEPQFCYAQPFVVDLSLPAKNLDVYGYDLDQMPLEMFVMNSAEFFEDVTFALTRKSHFHLVFDLGNKKLKLSGKNQTLALVWGHLVRYSIALIQPTTPLCLSAIETIPYGKALSYQPPVMSGDGRFGTAKVWANAVLDYESNKVDATFCLTAADPKDSGTVVAGCGAEYVYTSDPDRVIEAVFGGLHSRIAFSAGAPPDVEGAREGPVARWSFEGMDGQSLGSPQVTMHLREIRIVSTAPENCVSAIAYLEAKRNKALSANTIKRLDPQLTKIESEILKLRPRFAPPSG